MNPKFRGFWLALITTGQVTFKMRFYFGFIDEVLIKKCARILHFLSNATNQIDLFAEKPKTLLARIPRLRIGIKLTSMS